MVFQLLEQTVRRGPLFPAILTLALAGTFGCGDEVTDPDAFLESAEAEAVMQSAAALPMLPELADAAIASTPRDRAALVRARELWAAGSVNHPRAEARRRLAIVYARPILETALDDEDWTAARDRMEDWIVTVEGMLQQLALPEVRDRITAARRALRRADASAGDAARRTHHLMLAMSELVETTPRFVALRLVERAGRAVHAHTAGADGANRTMERAVRLKDWAERAVLEGEYLLAIQRAYYATQLVEGR